MTRIAERVDPWVDNHIQMLTLRHFHFFSPRAIFQFDKLLGDFIRVPLREYAQNSPSRFIHLNPSTQGAPTRTTPLW